MRMNYVQHTLNINTHKQSFEDIFFLFSRLWWLFFFGQKFSLHFAVALQFLYGSRAQFFFLRCVAFNSRDGNTLWAIMVAACTNDKYKIKASNNNNKQQPPLNVIKAFHVSNRIFSFSRVAIGVACVRWFDGNKNVDIDDEWHFALFHSRFAVFHLQS